MEERFYAARSEEGDDVEIGEVELAQVAGNGAVHGSLGIFAFGAVQHTGDFVLFLVGAGKDVFFIFVLADEFHEVCGGLVSEEDLAFAVLGIVLQIEGNGFGGAEVFHGFGDDLAQFLGHPEEMVDRILAAEDDGSIITQVDPVFAEIRGADSYDFKKFVESEINVVFF